MENNELMVKNFGKRELEGRKSKVESFTTIEVNEENIKKLYNLQNVECDYKINDCVGQLIRIKDVLIKNYERELDEPIYDENGEIIKDKEIKRVTILIDDNDKTYVTASKTFALQMIRFIDDFGVSAIENLEIKIIKRKVANSNNLALGFELV